MPWAQNISLMSHKTHIQQDHNPTHLNINTINGLPVSVGPGHGGSAFQCSVTRCCQHDASCWEARGCKTKEQYFKWITLLHTGILTAYRSDCRAGIGILAWCVFLFPLSSTFVVIERWVLTSIFLAVKADIFPQ